jgi:4-amino-4-deoxy-L-arabinose transferase-like glycosyltransferase
MADVRTGDARRRPPAIRLARLVELGLLVRILAADAVQWLAARRGTRCLFPDTDIYWLLAKAIRRGGPYQVDQWGVPHFSLRTPGYPLFLALCQTLFGERTLPARLAQAALGAACVVLVYRLVKSTWPEWHPPDAAGWTPALIAAALVAVEPYTVLTSAFLLSEALFLPLLLLGLWALASAWTGDPNRIHLPSALGAGLAFGAAVLVKPSFALFPPLIGLAWLLVGRRRAAVLGTCALGLGVALAMAPWWVRNADLYGRFVPTALWAGASLYDGLNPEATGGSDMDFLNAPDLQPLSEEDQDRVLRDRARTWAASHPRRTLELAVAKAARFWSPWPVGEGALSRSPWVKLAGALITLPVYALLLAGLWRCRRDARALALLAGTLLYFAAIHAVFVSSIRYRIPGMAPALGLAGAAASGWLAGRSRRSAA